MAKCIMELERIKGIRNGSFNEKGSNRIGDRDNLHDKTTSQKDLAVELNISQRQLSDYKKLTNLIPELQQMIENGSMKQSRVISEYERLCEVKHGGARGHNVRLNNQEQIAREFGITPRQLRRLKKLQDLIPELQDMVEDGEVKATVCEIFRRHIEKERKK